MIFGERSRGNMQIERDRHWRIEDREHIGNGLVYFAPVLAVVCAATRL